LVTGSLDFAPPGYGDAAGTNEVVTKLLTAVKERLTNRLIDLMFLGFANRVALYFA
jgi:hypothetical protein